MVGSWSAVCGAVLCSVFASIAEGQQIPWPSYEDEAVRLLQEYLRIDTQNPPGNEVRGANFFHRLFDQAGIANATYTFAPGRANFYARLKGDGRGRPIILLNHMDTVRAESARWKVPPLAGEIVDGELYGRGALDMKDLGLLQAMVLLIMAREHVPLHRDLIFLATADEEVSDRGSQWMIRNHPELLENAEYLLTEGGSAIRSAAGRTLYKIGVGEKAPLWIKMTATGPGGHGSLPILDSAPNRLVRAAYRLTLWEPPIRLLPVVEEYFHQIAVVEDEPLAGKLRNIATSLNDPSFVKELPRRYPNYNAILRDTISLTMMEAGRQTNVIPDSASCMFDARLLPDTDPQAFLAQLRQVVDDDRVQMEITEQFGAANSSPTDTPLLRLIERVLNVQTPDAVVAASLDQGYTESQMYRKLRIFAYGFNPVLVTSEVNATKHGENERVPVAQYRSALQIFFAVVRQVATEQHS